MIQTLVSFLTLGRELFIENKKNTNQLYTELEEVLAQKQFSLPASIKKRIFFYTSQSAITNYWFGILRGKRANAEEVKNGLYLGAFTPIADDLMDNSQKTFDQLLEEQNKNSAEAVLFTYLWQKLKPLRDSNQTFVKYFEKAQSAQDESIKQVGDLRLTDAELSQISFSKGGYSTLLYRSILENPLTEEEESAIYTLGSTLQLTNDIFDVYKDYQNGAQTVCTQVADFSKIRRLFDELTHRFHQQYFQIPAKRKNIAKSYRSIWTVLSRAVVALEQYQKLQGENAVLAIEKFDRKSLIVDMEKPVNIWKSIRITQKMGSSRL